MYVYVNQLNSDLTLTVWFVTNSSFQNYTHPDDYTKQTIGTPGFKPFPM